MIAALALLVATVPPTLPIPDGYVPIIDGTHSIVVAVPEGWGEVRVEPLILEDGSEAPYIVASPNVMRFYTSFAVPGMDYAALPYEINPLVYLDMFGLTVGCETIEVREYDDPDFVGVIQIGLHCGQRGHDVEHGRGLAARSLLYGDGACPGRRSPARQDGAAHVQCC